MGDQKRRRWQHYLRKPEEGGLKTALSASSAATFQAIRGKGDHINDHARLLVTEELLLTDGSTFTWEYFQLVQLVQQVLDTWSGMARLYAEKLRDNPPRQINYGASCLAVTSTRQAAKWFPSTVGKHGSRIQLCRVRARHPRVRRQLVYTRDREGSSV